MFIESTDSDEIPNIISSVNISKASGPFSIPSKILILIKKDISKQLADFFYHLALFHLYLKLPR